MGEIGSRAIHRCVVVFLSLSLVGRTMRARVCVGFKALVVSRLKEIRARDERERCTRKRQFRSAREKRSHHRLVFGRQKHVLFASSSVHFSHQKRQKAQMMILCAPSFVLCFPSRSRAFVYSPIHSLSLSVSLSGDCLFTNKQQASWNWRTKTARNLSKFRKKLDTTGTRNN
jgi:Flp pilus assembly protein TadB